MVFLQFVINAYIMLNYLVVNSTFTEIIVNIIKEG